MLVTGAAGALGRAVVERLEKEKRCRVIPTSRSGDNLRRALDVNNRDQIAAIIQDEKPDVILHLAATYSADLKEAYTANVEASHNILECLHRLGMQTRVLLVGSAAEYGKVREEECPIPESRVLMPMSIYGLTKAWQTQLAGLYVRLGVDVVVARIFNLDGPGLSDHLFLGRIQRQILEMSKGERSFIEVGALSATRDYVTTDRAAEQILAIAKYANTGGVFHVASGAPIQIREILCQYLVKNNLDDSLVRESATFSNHIGFDVSVIYADMTQTEKFLSRWRENENA